MHLHHAFRYLQEHLVDVFVQPRGRHHVTGVHAFGIFDVSLRVKVSLARHKIGFVADNDAHDVVAHDLLQLFDPHFDLVEGILARKVVDEDGTL